ncbi:hypothetical protein FGO68_gene6195 [Halteria grandinella]|uniref:Uncharacterized protein n=1 Tax=Halteria grandinella TaxID=5974 RepID=A0A8J8T3U2_HALGN|nr:hypothetical protein FGO68_gene6195 [Halteria grandinella]
MNEMLTKEMDEVKSKNQWLEQKYQEHLALIESLNQGHKQALTHIQESYQSKEKDLEQRFSKENSKFKQYLSEINTELKIKDTIINRLNGHIQILQGELKMAKQIFKDPQLSKNISRLYINHIETKQQDKLIQETSKLDEYLEKQEIEKKFNYTHKPLLKLESFDKNTIKIKRRAMNNSMNLTLNGETEAQSSAVGFSSSIMSNLEVQSRRPKTPGIYNSRKLAFSRNNQHSLIGGTLNQTTCYTRRRNQSLLSGCVLRESGGDKMFSPLADFTQSNK